MVVVVVAVVVDTLVEVVLPWVSLVAVVVLRRSDTRLANSTLRANGREGNANTRNTACGRRPVVVLSEAPDEGPSS